jgi:hypothetical protein
MFSLELSENVMEVDELTVSTKCGLPARRVFGDDVFIGRRR